METAIDFFDRPDDGNLLIKDGIVFQFEEDTIDSAHDCWIRQCDVETFFFLYPGRANEPCYRA